MQAALLAVFLVRLSVRHWTNNSAEKRCIKIQICVNFPERGNQRGAQTTNTVKMMPPYIFIYN